MNGQPATVQPEKTDPMERTGEEMEGIHVRELSKQYGKVCALDGVSATFEPGKLYGLLGRNGAGKTTLLNAMAGRLFANGGITLDGAPVAENDDALRKICMMGEATLYPEGMRVAEALRWSQVFWPGFDRAFAEQLAGQFGLPLRSKVRGLSTGYNTIFKLVIALSTAAPYLLLDEPVLGLDAGHRDLFYKVLVARYAENPFCAVLSTHLVEEVSALVEEVVILHRGRVLRQAPRDALLAQGYAVSGMAARVDAYTAGRTLMGSDSIGGLKTAYVWGERASELPEGLEVSGLDLQRLFVQMTGDDTEGTVA